MRCPMPMVLLLVLTFVGGCASKPKATDASESTGPTPLAIAELIHGDISGLDEPGVFLITSQDELQSYGSATLAALKVDFQTQALVLLALGKQPTGGYWARISDVVQLGDTLAVTGKANRPAADQIVPQVLTTPYCVAVIPKPAATRVRSDIASVIGEAPPAE